jgi:transcriptional regulator with XRE-family HTH domain
MPTHHSPDKALAHALRRLRQESENSQEDIAYKAGLTVAALARIERGKADPRWTTVRRISGALNINLSQLGVEVEDAAV